MVPALLAVIRIGRGTHARSRPHPSLLVHHLVVNAGLAVPDGFASPVGRGSQLCRLRGWRLRIAYRVSYLAYGMRDRIEHREEIRALLGRPVDLALGVDGGLAPVGRDQVMHVAGGRAPVPQAEDDVALHPLRPRRLVERQLAGGDPDGPVAPQGE